MKNILIVLFVVVNICSAQQKNKDFFVWAKNGLSLRSSASTDAKKVETIPYGERVKFLSYDKNYYTVTEFKGFDYSDGWVKVNYNNTEGYVFNGYLSPITPPELNTDKSPVNSILQYIKNNHKQLDKKITEYYFGCTGEDCQESAAIYTFEGGITYSYWSGEGGGSQTLVLPKSNMLHAFTLASLFCRNYKDFKTVYTETPLPTIKVMRDDVGCDFTITTLNDYVIILWTGGC